MQTTQHQPQISLVEVTDALLDADHNSDNDTLGELLGATVAEWPPIGGEWDQNAITFFRAQLNNAAFDPFWGPRYVIVDRRLVGSAGFFGPPDIGPPGNTGEHPNEVEIGYSVATMERRQGIATATVNTLCELAREQGAQSVRARTTTSNIASLRTLDRTGFQPATNPDSPPTESLHRRALTPRLAS
jgi:RimJ/RimL family protein N-acetyltransferase